MTKKKREDAQMLSRRGFLNSAFGAGLALTTAQQAPAQTPAVQPARKRLIVDAQVHLWKAESPDWPWVPGRTPQMPEPFTIEKLVPLMDEAGVDRAVIVPPSWPGDRNDYALEAVRRYPGRFAAIGRAAAEMEGAAGHARRAAHAPSRAERAARERRRRLVLAGGREGAAACHVFGSRQRAEVQAHRRTSPATAVYHRSHESDPRDREGPRDQDHDRRGGGARQISQCVGQALFLAHIFARGLSVARHDRASEALFRRLRPAALLLGNRPHQRVRQVDLPAAHHAFHRRTGLSVGGG